MDSAGTAVVEATKRYVCDDRFRLRLFETVGREVQKVAGTLGEERFSVSAGWSSERFSERVSAFEHAVADLCRVEALAATWAGDSATAALTLPLRRFSDQLDVRSGNSGWLALRWYPCLLLLYAGGVAAVSSGRYGVVYALLHARVQSSGKDEPLVKAVVDGFGDVRQTFEKLPGLERHRTPASDRLFHILQPILDDLLFMGSDFERAFDRFEILSALEYAHLSGRGWGPIGQFGWKGSRTESSPLAIAIREASAAGNSWPPLAAGLFGGSIEEFKAIAQVTADHLARVMW